MNLKQFIKPDWRKIVMLLILFILSSFISAYFGTKTLIGFGTSSKIGFPLIFYIQITPGIEYKASSNFNILNFILDIIAWYLLSCLIVWIYDVAKR